MLRPGLSTAASVGAQQIETTPYNQGNCQFAAEVLNANLRRVAAERGSEADARFWCEPGASAHRVCRKHPRQTICPSPLLAYSSLDGQYGF